ncbi:MAG TPA: hypothetical protein PKK63_06720, partial [Bacillota bacterium]|nr:hypothetical protein [Bacillota bacterium]
WAGAFGQLFGGVANLIAVNVDTVVSAVMVVMMELDTSAELPDMIPASSFTAASGMFIAKRTNNVLAPIAYLSSIVFNSTSISTIWLI